MEGLYWPKFPAKTQTEDTSQKYGYPLGFSAPDPKKHLILDGG